MRACSVSDVCISLSSPLNCCCKQVCSDVSVLAASWFTDSYVLMRSVRDEPKLASSSEGYFLHNVLRPSRVESMLPC